MIFMDVIYCSIRPRVSDPRLLREVGDHVVQKDFEVNCLTIEFYILYLIKKILALPDWLWLFKVIPQRAKT